MCLQKINLYYIRYVLLFFRSPHKVVFTEAFSIFAQIVPIYLLAHGLEVQGHYHVLSCLFVGDGHYLNKNRQVGKIN